jgi:predicted transposase/invertase (TIGR01784 family)
MTREQFAQFLAELKKASDNGQDIDAIVKKHEHENVYFYNDGCIKKILANEKNLVLTTDLINAALNLIGTDRIKNPKLVNPFIPGEIGYRSVEPDLLLVNERGKNVPRDRISVDVQHETGSFFKDRLVLYVSRLTNNMVKRGDVPKLDNLHVISFQFFNAFAESTNYRHKVQLQNQEQQVYFDRQTVTLIEVEKFLKNAQNFADDNSRLAQWLRAIDSLNRGADFSEYAQDPVFRLLQNEVKMCNFSSRYLMTEAMMVLDKDYIFYDAQDKKAREVAKDLLIEGDSVEKVVRVSKLSEADVLAIKAEIDQK